MTGPSRLLLIATLTMISSASATARSLPDDCSTAAAPEQPVEVSVLGTGFTPTSVTVHSAGYVKTGGEEFDSYRLALRSEDSTMSPLEAEVTFIVLKRASIEGRVFRRLATKDFSKQPSASKNQSESEVQGWVFHNRPARADSSHVGHLASLRLEFGQRSGDTIPGNIYLCVAKGQTTIFNKTPTKKESFAVGAFDAQVKW